MLRAAISPVCNREFSAVIMHYSRVRLGFSVSRYTTLVPITIYLLSCQGHCSLEVKLMWWLQAKAPFGFRAGSRGRGSARGDYTLMTLKWHLTNQLHWRGGNILHKFKWSYQLTKMSAKKASYNLRDEDDGFDEIKVAKSEVQKKRHAVGWSFEICLIERMPIQLNPHGWI